MKEVATILLLVLLPIARANPLLSTTTKSINSSLNGKHLKIVAEDWPPWFLMKTSPTNSSQMTYGGMLYKMLVYLQENLNFTYNIIRSHDGKWGVGDENGDWNGMIGMLHRNEVDMAIGPFAVFYAREQVCDFTYPISVEPWVVLIAVKPKLDPWPMIRPFEWHVWLCMAISVPAFIITLGLSDWAFRDLPADWQSITGFTLRVVFYQAPAWCPQKFIYNKVFGAVWLLAFFVLVPTYAGVLTSILAIPTVEVPIDSVQELVTQSDIDYAIESGSILEQIGREATEGIFHDLYVGSAIRSPYGCASTAADIKAGKFAEVCDANTIRKIISDDFGLEAKCNFYMGSKALISTSFAMAFRETGMQKHWFAELLPNATKCDGMAKIVASRGKLGAEPIVIYELLTVIVMLAGGLTVAVATFCIELSQGDKNKLQGDEIEVWNDHTKN